MDEVWVEVKERNVYYKVCISNKHCILLCFDVLTAVLFDLICENLTQVAVSLSVNWNFDFWEPAEIFDPEQTCKPACFQRLISDLKLAALIIIRAAAVDVWVPWFIAYGAWQFEASI
jgi:hypothetical protein